RRRRHLRVGPVRPRAPRAVVLARRRLSGRRLPLRDVPGRGGPVRRGVVLGVLVLASTGACRRAPSACGGGPRIVLLAPTAPVGFDAEVTLEARPLCPEARAGTIAWRSLGAPSVVLSPADGGFTVRTRTPTLAASL